MRSRSLVIASLSCVTIQATTSSSSAPPRSSSVLLSRRRRVSFLTTTPATSLSSSSWRTIPRGGSDNGDGGGAPAPGFDLSSLLSGMNIPGGLPDLSQPPSPEQLAQSMEQITSLLSSPQFTEMLADPAKMETTLETLRTALLGALDEMEKGDNPMMTMMLAQVKGQVGAAFPGGWDGLVAMVKDAAQWKELTGGLIEVMKSLGEEDLKGLMSQAMGAAGGGGLPGMGGPPGAGGAGGLGGGFPGLGGNTLGDALGGDAAGTLAGLDDLSEGED